MTRVNTVDTNTENFISLKGSTKKVDKRFNKFASVHTSPVDGCSYIVNSDINFGCFVISNSGEVKQFNHFVDVNGEDMATLIDMKGAVSMVKFDDFMLMFNRVIATNNPLLHTIIPTVANEVIVNKFVCIEGVYDMKGELQYSSTNGFIDVFKLKDTKIKIY